MIFSALIIKGIKLYLKLRLLCKCRMVFNVFKEYLELVLQLSVCFGYVIFTGSFEQEGFSRSFSRSFESNGALVGVLIKRIWAFIVRFGHIFACLQLINVLLSLVICHIWVHICSTSTHECKMFNSCLGRTTCGHPHIYYIVKEIYSYIFIYYLIIWTCHCSW